jgi:hypothetical protein
MASSRWWLPSGRRRTTQCTSPPSVGSVLREATPHVLASGRSCTWAAQVPNSPADRCLNNPEPPEIFPSRKSATHQKLRQGIMSLGLTTHDKKCIFKGEPAIARAGGAGCIRRLASSLLAGNPEVGAARHWRHARHGEGSRQQSDIRRGRRSLRARLPTRAAHCAGLAPRVQARPHDRRHTPGDTAAPRRASRRPMGPSQRAVHARARGLHTRHIVAASRSPFPVPGTRAADMDDAMLASRPALGRSRRCQRMTHLILTIPSAEKSSPESHFFWQPRLPRPCQGCCTAAPRADLVRAGRRRLHRQPKSEGMDESRGAICPGPR